MLDSIFKLSRNSKHILGEEVGKTCDDQALVLWALEHDTIELIQRVVFSRSVNNERRRKAPWADVTYLQDAV